MNESVRINTHEHLLKISVIHRLVGKVFAHTPLVYRAIFFPPLVKEFIASINPHFSIKGSPPEIPMIYFFLLK